MEVGIEGSTRKKKLAKVSEVVEEVEVRVESWVNVKTSGGPLIEEEEVETRLEEEATPSKSSGDKAIEIDLVREEISVGAEEEIEIEPQVAMDLNGGKGGPPPIPPIPPIDSLVRPRGLPILVPQNLVAMDMPSNLP